MMNKLCQDQQATQNRRKENGREPTKSVDPVRKSYILVPRTMLEPVKDVDRKFRDMVRVFEENAINSDYSEGLQRMWDVLERTLKRMESHMSEFFIRKKHRWVKVYLPTDEDRKIKKKVPSSRGRGLAPVTVEELEKLLAALQVETKKVCDGGTRSCPTQDSGTNSD